MANTTRSTLTIEIMGSDYATVRAEHECDRRAGLSMVCGKGAS